VRTEPNSVLQVIIIPRSANLLFINENKWEEKAYNTASHLPQGSSYLNFHAKYPPNGKRK